MIRTVQMLAALVLGTLLQGCVGDHITGPSPGPSPVRSHSCVTTLDPNAPPPLYVIDGERLSHVEVGARRVRSEDIESLEVLKGPAAVARFGVAAEHGVLLIRTRSAPVHKPAP
jgi:TonB-dependent SusC/RagA subfamily outer membrane receptor